MRDVRGVFIGLLRWPRSLVIVLWSPPVDAAGPGGSWRAVRRGAVGLIASRRRARGSSSFVASTPLFEMFHRSSSRAVRTPSTRPRTGSSSSSRSCSGRRPRSPSAWSIIASRCSWRGSPTRSGRDQAADAVAAPAADRPAPRPSDDAPTGCSPSRRRGTRSWRRSPDRSATERVAVGRRRSAASSPSRSSAGSRCRPGTTPRWTATRSGPRTSPARPRTSPSASRSSARSAPAATRRTSTSGPAPRSGSRPGRRPARRRRGRPGRGDDARSTRPGPPARAAATPPVRCRPRPRPRGGSGRRLHPPRRQRPRGGRRPARAGHGRDRRPSSRSPAGAGVDRSRVHRRPRVAVLATGDEVRAPGEPLGPAGIPDANGPGLARARRGGRRRRRPTSASPSTDLDDVRARLRPASMAAPTRSSCPAASRSGRTTSCETAFEAFGTIDLWRVAVQPGKPFAFGTAARPAADRRRSCFRPARQPGLDLRHLRALRPAGAAPARRPPRRRPASAGRPGGPRRARHARATAGAASSASIAERDDDGRRPCATPRAASAVRLAGGQGSHVLSALATADALAVIPEADDQLPAGAEVELWWLDRA